MIGFSWPRRAACLLLTMSFAAQAQPLYQWPAPNGLLLSASIGGGQRLLFECHGNTVSLRGTVPDPFFDDTGLGGQMVDVVTVSPLKDTITASNKVTLYAPLLAGSYRATCQAGKLALRLGKGLELIRVKLRE